MGSIAAQLIILILCLVFSSFFSATETAFSTLNRVHIKTLASAGSKRAALVLCMTDDFDRLLSTVLIGNNIVNILAASLATTLFTAWLGGSGVTVSTLVMTLIVLVFGEITPKSLAKESPERFSMTVAPFVRFLMRLFAPLNAVFSKWRRLLSRVFRHSDERVVTEEEIMTLIDEAQTGGEIDAHEGELIRSAIEFNDLDAADIITPRVSVIALEDSATREETARMFREHGFSRLPVYHEDMDHIIGVIHEKDFHELDPGVGVMAAVKPAVFAPATLKISKLLRLLQTSKTHLCVVVDEFGGTEGIVTLEDVLEELVGEIYDEHDDVTEEYREATDGSLLVDGSADLTDTLERFGIEDIYEADTIGGWMTEMTGHIPAAGEQITVGGITITVSRADQRRVIEVRIQKGANASQNENASAQDGDLIRHVADGA